MNNYFVMEQLAKDRQRELQQLAARQRRLGEKREPRDYALRAIFRPLADQGLTLFRRIVPEKLGCNNYPSADKPMGATAGC